MSFFDDFLATKVAPEDRAILDKYPELKASAAALEQHYQQASQKVNAWDEWGKNNWDAQAGMTRAEKELRTELAAAQSRVNAGVGTSDDLKALRTEFEGKVADIQAKAQKSIDDKVNGLNYFYESVTRHAFDHQKEFGETLDPGKFREYIVANSLGDADVAYDKMVATRRSEAAAQRAKDNDAANKKALEEAEVRGYNRAAQERAMGPAGMSPTDNTGGIAGITAHVGGKAPTITDEEKAFIANAKLESGELAKLGYAKFLKGDFGPLQ